VALGAAEDELAIKREHLTALKAERESMTTELQELRTRVIHQESAMKAREQELAMCRYVVNLGTVGW
jgi:hypothetical protein